MELEAAEFLELCRYLNVRPESFRRTECDDTDARCTTYNLIKISVMNVEAGRMLRAYRTFITVRSAMYRFTNRHVLYVTQRVGE